MAAGHLLGEGLDARRVEPGIGLGEAEAALIFAGDEPGPPTRLLLGGTLHDDRMRAEEVAVDRRGGGKAATAGGDLAHHRHRLRAAEPRAAISLGPGKADKR